MAYMLGVLKLFLCVASALLCFLGVYETVYGLGGQVYLPEMKIPNLVEIGSGIVPTGIALVVLGAILFLVFSRWKITVSSSKKVSKAGLETENTVTTIFNLDDRDD